MKTLTYKAVNFQYFNENTKKRSCLSTLSDYPNSQLASIDRKLRMKSTKNLILNLTIISVGLNIISIGIALHDMIFHKTKDDERKTNLSYSSKIPPDSLSKTSAEVLIKCLGEFPV